MKKIVIIWMGLMVIGLSVIAQNNTESTDNQTKNKKDKVERNLLPEQGDWAIGVDVVPILRTLGNIFWGDSKPNSGFQGTPVMFDERPNPNISIMAKYMILENCAIRANVGVNIMSTTRNFTIPNDKARLDDPTSLANVTDRQRTNTYGFSLALGSEYRLGKKRVVGVFGGDLLFGFYGRTVKNTFGNKITEENQVPTTGAPNVAFADADYPSLNQARKLYEKNEGTYALGAQVTAGIEVFIAPKIALGGQVNLSYVFMYNTKTHCEAEGYSTLTHKVEKVKKIQTPAQWSHTFNTNNLGAALYMIFYF